MYKNRNKEGEFYRLKPDLTDRQHSLLNAFYRLSQERRSNQGAPFPIIDRDIHYYQSVNGSCSYADDLFIMAIHTIDTEYISIECDKIQRRLKKVK